MGDDSLQGAGLGLDSHIVCRAQWLPLLQTEVFLSIRPQSGIHLFNIQSNTLQSAWPCTSAPPPVLFGRRSVCDVYSSRKRWRVCEPRTGFLCDCQRVSAPSSPLSSKLKPSLCSRLWVFFLFVCFFAHWVFIINVNKLEGHPLSSLSSHL